MINPRLHREQAVGEEHVQITVSQPPEQKEVPLWRGLEEKQLEKTNSTLTLRRSDPLLCSFVGTEKKAMCVRRAFSRLIRAPFRYALSIGVLILSTEGPWEENLASPFH